jgi:hypothetical protein
MDKPPLSTSQALAGDGSVNKRVIVSRSGHTIMLDDTDNGEEITIVDKTGKNRIVFHSPDNSLRIEAQGDLTIESQGKMVLRAAAGMEISTQAKMEVTGDAGVEVSSAAQLKLEGQAGAELSAGAVAKVKGAMVNIEGSGPVKVQGMPVALN